MGFSPSDEPTAEHSTVWRGYRQVRKQIRGKANGPPVSGPFPFRYNLTRGSHSSPVVRSSSPQSGHSIQLAALAPPLSAMCASNLLPHSDFNVMTTNITTPFVVANDRILYHRPTRRESRYAIHRSFQHTRGGCLWSRFPANQIGGDTYTSALGSRPST